MLPEEHPALSLSRLYGTIPVEVKIRVVGFLVGIAHIIAGIAIWKEPVAIGVTQLAYYRILVEWLDALPWAGPLLIAVGAMAIVAARDRRHPLMRGALFIPQQVLIVLEAAAVFWVFVMGAYPDGYVPAGKGWFILSDKILFFLLVTSHSIWLAGLIWGGLAGGRDRVR